MFYKITVVGLDVFYRNADSIYPASLKREFKKTFLGCKIKVELVR